MISVWFFFWLHHVLASGQNQWWDFPFFATGIVAAMFEVISYFILLDHFLRKMEKRK